MHFFLDHNKYFGFRINYVLKFEPKLNYTTNCILKLYYKLYILAITNYSIFSVCSILQHELNTSDYVYHIWHKTITEIPHQKLACSTMIFCRYLKTKKWVIKSTILIHIMHKYNAAMESNLPDIIKWWSQTCS